MLATAFNSLYKKFIFSAAFLSFVDALKIYFAMNCYIKIAIMLSPGVIHIIGIILLSGTVIFLFLTAVKEMLEEK